MVILHKISISANFSKYLNNPMNIAKVCEMQNEGILRILQNYLVERNRSFSGNELASFIRSDFPREIREIIDNGLNMMVAYLYGTNIAVGLIRGWYSLKGKC